MQSSEKSIAYRQKLLELAWDIISNPGYPAKRQSWQDYFGSSFESDLSEASHAFFETMYLRVIQEREIDWLKKNLPRFVEDENKWHKEYAAEVGALPARERIELL